MGHDMSGQTDGRDYAIYAPTPWDGPTQAAHNLARALAERHRVLYMDPPASPLSPFRYGLRHNSWPQLRTVLDRRVRRAGRLAVFTPLVLPPIRHPRARALSLPALRRQFGWAVRGAGLRRPVIVAWQDLAELSGVVDERLRVAMVMDHPAGGAALMGLDPAEAEAETTALCTAAQLVCTTSRAVQELLAERGWQSEFLPFGFPEDLADAFDRATPPPEYETLPRPILGYTGGIDDRLDFELVLALADRFREGSIVFVGSVSPRLSASSHEALGARANVHLLGSRPREQLPGYVRHLDVALMPYRETLFTRYQSPIKLWEYLYAGPPIVGTGSVALRGYPPPLVDYAESGEEALRMVERALADPAVGREERRRFALANTWRDRVEQLDALVDRRLNPALGGQSNGEVGSTRAKPGIRSPR